MIPQLLFKNSDWVIFLKPAKVHSVSGKGHSFLETLFAAQSPDVNFALPEYGLLHRLDYETSGILAFAKNEDAYRLGKEYWKTVRVRKRYWGAVNRSAWRSFCDRYAHDPLIPLLVTANYLSRYRGSKKVSFILTEIKDVADDDFFLTLAGQPEIGLTKIHATSYRPEASENIILEFEIFTGVRHQIRAMASGLKIPLIGESIYGNAPETALLHLHHGHFTMKLPEYESVEVFSPPQWAAVVHNESL